MFCTRCGAQCDDNTKFCSSCGAPMEQAENAAPVVEAEPVYNYEQPVEVVSAKPVSSVPALVWGIVGLSCALIPYVNFLGIIFSCIAKKKVKQVGEPLPTMAKVGKGLSTAGLIVGIICTVVFAVLIIVAISSVIQYGDGFMEELYYALN